MSSRGRDMRAARRAAHFARFRMTELNLVPLVDALVSIVFFALTTATVGELSPVVPGVRLPEAHVGAAALQQLTLGIGPQVTLGGRPIMSTLDVPLAIQGDKSMRYDLLARMMQTARLAGFRNLSLQVSKQEGPVDSTAAATGAR